MNIQKEIEKFSYNELLEINRKIVERLKILREAQNKIEIKQFGIGNSVEFWTEDGELVSGIVSKINKKTVGIVTLDGERWKVSPSLLNIVSKKRPRHEPEQDVIDFTEAKKA